MRDPLHDEDRRVLSHEPNAEVIAFLRERAVQRTDGTYQEHTHPDLVDLLRTSGDGLGATVEYFYGFPTLVGSNGVVFAYALGTSVIVFRAPAGGFGRDLPAGIEGLEVVPGWV